MAQEQTAYEGGDISVLVNVIDSTGAHVAATINTTTTRIDGFSTQPSVTTVSTGIYKINFASVTPAPAEGDRLVVKVNGDISGTAWSEYGIPVLIVADERGTDSVVVPTSDITAIKAKTDQLAFTVANQVDANSLTGGTSPADIYTYFTSGTNEDVFKADTSTLATSAALSGVESKIDTIDTNVDSILVDTGTDIPASIAALNDISAADVWTYSTRTITSGGITQAEVAAAVWNASLSGYNSAGSTGKALRQIKEGVISTDGSVNDTSATATTFVSNLTETADGFYHDKIIVFISGDLLGQARHIETYVGSTKAITVSVPLTSAPQDGDEFLILSSQSFSLNEHAEAVWSDTHSSYTTDGTFGYYLDAQVSSAGAGGSGLYQVTVTVQNEDGDVLQGARVNVDGTTLTLVTDSSGQCVFNLDSGVYTLHVSPPAGYQTPTGNVITISASDISSTFTLEATAPSGDCDVPWVG